MIRKAMPGDKVFPVPACKKCHKHDVEKTASRTYKRYPLTNKS